MRLTFEDFELDPREARLVRAGKPVDLQPKHFEALLFFASRAGRLVTHAELMEGLWPDVHVNEEALQQVVSKLRKALGDSARDPRFLATVPKRGYRFLPSVTTLEDEAPRRPPFSIDPPKGPSPAAISTSPAPEIAPASPGAAGEAPAPIEPQRAPSPPPEAANPAPQTANLAPQAANLAPQTTNLAPQAADLAPQTGNLPRETANLAPEAADLAPKTAHLDAPLPLPDKPARRARLSLVVLPALAAAVAMGAVAAARRPPPRAPETPRPGATRSLTHSLERKQEASFTPDGHAVVFAANDAEEGQYDLYLLALAEGGARQRLTHTAADEFYPHVSPDGATVLFSSFESGSPSAHTIPITGGAAKKVAPRAAYATYSPDGASIAFLRPLARGGHAIIARDLASSAERTLAETPGEAQSLTWSPDGESLAFSDDRRVLLVPARGGEPRPFGSPAQQVRSVAWDPRGGGLIADPNWSGRSNLWWIPVDGVPTALTASAGGVHHPAFSPDGRLVVYSVEAKHMIVRRAFADGRVTTIPVPASADCAALDPAGKHLAVTDWEAGLDDRMSLVDLDGDGSARRSLGVGRCPRVSPDGKRVAFSHDDHLTLLDLATDERSPLGAVESRLIGAPAWSPDGRRIAAVMRDGGGEALAITDVTTGARAKLPPGPTGPLTYSPDGKWLAVTAQDGTWLVDAGTGAARRLTPKHSYENPPSWRDDGREISILIDERSHPAMIRLRLDGSEAGRAALPALPDPAFWGIFTALPTHDGGLVVVQTRYQADLYLLDLQR